MAGEKLYLGVGVETTFGTGVTAQAFLDAERMELDVPDSPHITYAGSAGGRMASVVEAGPYIPQGALVVGVDASNIGYFLRPFFGSYGVTGSGTFTHTFDVSDVEVLPSITARIGRRVFEHVFAGTSGNRLVLEAGRSTNGFLRATGDMISAGDTRTSLNTSSKSLASNYYTRHLGSVAVASGSINADLDDIRVELNNNIAAEDGVRFSSVAPAELPLGTVEVSGGLTMAFKTNAEYERFAGNPHNIVATFTRSAQQFIIRVPAAKWSRVHAPVEGPNRITQEVSFQGLLDGGTGTSLRVQIVNTTASYAAA